MKKTIKKITKLEFNKQKKSKNLKKSHNLKKRKRKKTFSSSRN